MDLRLCICLAAANRFVVYGKGGKGWAHPLNATLKSKERSKELQPPTTFRRRGLQIDLTLFFLG